MSQTHYHIILSESQRQILAEAMSRFDPTILEGTDPTTGATLTEEATILSDLLQDLPEVETADPDIVHGLAY